MNSDGSLSYYFVMLITPRQDVNGVTELVLKLLGSLSKDDDDNGNKNATKQWA